MLIGATCFCPHAIQKDVRGAGTPVIIQETGNAVKNENIVRKELGLQERVEDIKHVE